MFGGMNHEGPIISNYTPISSKGGAKKKKSKKRRTRRNKTNKSRTRRYR